MTTFMSRFERRVCEKKNITEEELRKLDYVTFEYSKDSDEDTYSLALSEEEVLDDLEDIRLDIIRSQPPTCDELEYESNILRFRDYGQNPSSHDLSSLISTFLYVQLPLALLVGYSNDEEVEY